MIKKIVFLALVVILILVGRKVIKHYPKADKAFVSMTDEIQEVCETRWKSAQKSYKKNFNHKNMDKRLKVAKAPFTKFLKKNNTKKNEPVKHNNFTIVNDAPPPTAIKTAHN